MTAPDDRLLKLGEAARFLGIHTGTLRRWADEGRIAAETNAAGHRKFLLSELERYKNESAKKKPER